MQQNEEYTKNYQKQYYERVTKLKRKLKSIEKKAEIEKQKVTLSVEPREVIYTCPLCNTEYVELSHSIKPKKKKLCKACKRKVLNERARLPKNKEKANERRRYRYHNEEGYKEKIAEATKKWRAKYEEETQKLIQEIQAEKLEETKQVKVKKRRGRKPNILTAEFTPKKAILIKKEKPEK